MIGEVHNSRMKLVTYLAILAAGLLIGCTSSRSVLSIVPQEPFSPRSEAELLSELNAQLPFGIPAKDFIAKQKSGTFVGWAVVRTDDQKETVKARLAQSTTLRLLQVEALTPEFEAVMR